MYEGSRIKEGLAIAAIAGLGAIGLSGCGLSNQGSWKVGIVCPQPTEKAQVNYIDLEHDFKGQAAVAVSCNQGTVTEAPTSMELLRGRGESSPPPRIDPGDKIMHIYYTYEGGIFAPGAQRSPNIDGFPTITDPDTGEELGLVSISGVSHIDSAVVNP